MNEKHNRDTIAAATFPLKKTKVEFPAGGTDRKMALLRKVLEHHMIGNDFVHYEVLLFDLGITKRTKKSCGEDWKALCDEHFIEASDNKDSKGYQITQKGKDYAATDEYREFLKESSYIPMTNEEKHERIKKRLVWQVFGCQIFDLLLKYGELTIEEVAAIIGVKRGMHKFSFAAKELQDKFYVETATSTNHSKKVRLSNACFLKPEDRPKTTLFDSYELSLLIKANNDCKGHFQRMRKASLPRAYNKGKHKVPLKQREEADGSSPPCVGGIGLLQGANLVDGTPVEIMKQHPTTPAVIADIDHDAESGKPRIVICLGVHNNRIVGGEEKFVSS